MFTSSITNYSTLWSLCIALGLGLLIGAERERRKTAGPNRSAAGIRTFAVSALLGAVAMLSGGSLLMAAVVLIVGILAVVSYQRDQDPGMTTEVSLILTCLLGGLAVREANLAASIGVALAVLLAGRDRIHYFVRGVLTEHELHDALLFSAAALIFLPVAPNRYLGPFDAINPHAITGLIVLMMAIGSLGHIATRMLGARFGLPIAGFAAGFISSTATIHSMGLHSVKHPTQLTGAVAGAILSSIATFMLLAVVVAVIQPTLLRELLIPLVFGGIAATGYGLFFVIREISGKAEQANAENIDRDKDLGHAFDLKSALIFAAIITTVLLISAALSAWLGSRGTMLSACVTGLADPHATAASIASLVASGKVPMQGALWPIIAGLTANTLMKAMVAFNAGGAIYAARIVPGLALMTAATWAGVLLGQLV